MTDLKPEEGPPSFAPGAAAPQAGARHTLGEETGAEHLARMRQVRHRRESYSPRPEGRII